MARRKKRKVPDDDPLAPYRRVRKPVAPPARIQDDRRREIREEASEREARDALREPGHRDGDGDRG